MKTSRSIISPLFAILATACSGELSSSRPSNTDAGSNGSADAHESLKQSIQFDPPHGFFAASTTLTISSDLEHDEIRFTTDGSKPSSQNGQAYSGSIALDTTTVVRAVLLKSGVAVSPVETESYLFPESVFVQGDERPEGEYVFWTTEMDPVITTAPEYADKLTTALYSIPSISIVAPDESIFGSAGIHRGNNLMEGSGGEAGDPNDANWKEEVEASIEMIYPPNYPRGNFAGFQLDAGLRIQGGGGRWYNGEYAHKQSFGLRFRSEFGAKSLRYPIFEDAPLHKDTAIAKFDKLILRAGHNKGWGTTWDNEHTCYARDQMGRDLQLDMSGIGVHGTYVHLFINGLYWGLYNVTERPDDAHAANYFGGDETDWYSGKAKGGTVDGDSTRFDAWRSSIAGNGNFSELQQYLDVDKYIDMCLLNVYAATGDFPQYYFANQNTPTAGPLYFFAWDMEDAFGGGSKRTGPPDTQRFDGCYEFYKMWDATSEFRERVATRALELTGPSGALADAHVTATWDSLTSYIEDAMILESARWGDERISDTGTRYTRDEHWQNARELVTNDLQGRANQLLEVLRNTTRNGTPYLDQ